MEPRQLVQIAVLGDVAIKYEEHTHIHTGQQLEEQETMLDVYEYRFVPRWKDPREPSVARLLPKALCQILATIPSSGGVILSEKQRYALRKAHELAYPSTAEASI